MLHNAVTVFNLGNATVSFANFGSANDIITFASILVLTTLPLPVPKVLA